MIYLVYRWVMALYFAGWVAGSGYVGHVRHGAKYIIYITSWHFILLTVYLIAAAIAVTAKFMFENFIKKTPPESFTVEDLRDPPTLRCVCGEGGEGGLPWYLQVVWVLFLITSELALPIILVYWATVFDASNVTSWAVNIHEHLLSILPGLMDTFITAIPVRLLQFVYLMMFAMVYTVFTGIYYAAGGTNTAGERYVYSIIDYGNSPGMAVGVIIVLVFVVPLVLHSLYWGLYMLRTLLLHCWLKKSQKYHTQSGNTCTPMSNGETSTTSL